MPLTGSEGGAPLRRIHVWSPVAFAHLRAHRCGVLVRPEVDTIEAFCHEPPTHRAEIRPLPPFGSPVTALCATHAEEAKRWPTVSALAPFRQLAEFGEG